ncbi:hypothetical protein OY671_008821, partial [Metschnikowia pulcherrima]
HLRQPRDRARGGAPRPLPGCRRQAAAVHAGGQQRHGRGRAGPAARPGDGAQAPGQAAVGRPVPARHPAGRAGLRGLAAPAQTAGGQQGIAAPAGRRGLFLCARRQRSAGRPSAEESRLRGHAAGGGAGRRGRLLPGRYRPRHRGGGARAPQARRPDAGRSGRLPAAPARPGSRRLSRLSAVRHGPAQQRPDRGAADAGRAGAISERRFRARQRRGGALLRRGRPAGLRRSRLLRGRPGFRPRAGAR